MTYKEFKKAVQLFDGWIENEIAYFPSVYQKEQFLKYQESKGE